jgi:hypothetical protein
MLLTEYTSAQGECLHESELPRWRFKSVVLMKANSLGKNGRTYPVEVMAEAVAKYVQEKVEPGLAFGCLQHDVGAELSPEHISHRIVSLRMIGEDVVGDVEVLDSEMGRTLSAMLESNGGVMGFSSRSLGAVDKKGVVQPGLQIQAIDAVLSPANTGGTLAHAIFEDDAGVPMTAADPRAMAGLGKRDAPMRRVMDSMKKHFRSERLAKGPHVNTEPTIDQFDGRGETPAAQSLRKIRGPITMTSGKGISEESDYGRPAKELGHGGAQWRKPKSLQPDKGTADIVQKQSTTPSVSKPDRGKLPINEQALSVLKRCPADHPLREAAAAVLRAHWGSGIVPSKPMHAAATYFKKVTKTGSGHPADNILSRAFGTVHRAIKQAHAEGMGAHHLGQAMKAHAVGNKELAKAHEIIATHHVGAGAVKVAKARAVVGEDEGRFTVARAKAKAISDAIQVEGCGQRPHHFVGREPDEVRERNHRMGINREGRG